MFPANTEISLALQNRILTAYQVVSLFKEKSTAAVFGIIILSAGLRAFFWQSPPQVVSNPGDGFIFYLLEQVKLLPAALLPVIYHIVVIVQSMRLNYVLNEARLFPKIAFTTALAYILLTALFRAGTTYHRL